MPHFSDYKFLELHASSIRKSESVSNAEMSSLIELKYRNVVLIIAQNDFNKETERNENWKSNDEKYVFSLRPAEELKLKEFLTVTDLIILLNCSIRSANNIILKASNKAVIVKSTNQQSLTVTIKYPEMVAGYSPIFNTTSHRALVKRTCGYCKISSLIWNFLFFSKPCTQTYCCMTYII